MRLEKEIKFFLTLLVIAMLALAGCQQPQEGGEEEKSGEEAEKGDEAKGEGEAGEEEAGEEEAGEEEAEGDNEEAADDSDGEETAAAEPATDAAASFDPSSLTVLELLPGNMPILALTPNVQQTAEDLGRSYFIEKFQPQYNELVAQMKEDIGYNLLDPKEVSELGVKPDGAAGFGMLDMDKEVFGFFIEVSDAEKLEKALAAFIEKEDKKVEREEVGDFILLTGEEKKGGVLIGKGWMMLVGSDVEGAGLAAAKAVAERSADDSLAKSDKFSKSVGGLRNNRHLVAYVDSDALQSLAQRNDQERVVSLQAQVKELKSSGADAAQVEVMEQELAMRKQELEEQSRNLRMVLGNVDGVGLGVDASGQTLGVELDVVANKDGIAKILANAKTTPAIINASSSAPLALVSFNVVPEGVYDAFGQLVKAEGGDMAMFDQAVMAVTGMDLKADIIGNLTGEVGVLVDGELSEIQSPADFKGGAVLGVKDPKKAMEMLDKLASIPQAGDRITRDGETLIITAPEFGEIHIQVSGNFITVSNDAEFAKQVAAGSDNSFVSSVDHEALKTALNDTESAALIIFEPKVLGMWMLAGDMDVSTSVPTMPANADSQLKKKYDELQQINAKIDELRAEERKKQNSTLLAAFEPLGTTAMFLRVTDTGVELEAGQFMNADGMPELIDALLETAMGMQSDKGSASGDELANLYSQRWELEDAIFNQVMNDGAKEPTPVVKERKSTVVKKPNRKVVNPKRKVVKQPRKKGN